MMKTTRILILGKTYPDLTFSSTEKIMAGGCTEKGNLIRLYPIPLRYLVNHLSYRAYDWIEAPMAPSTQDPRPECYNIMSKDIKVIGKIYPNKGWSNRDRFIYADTSWHYHCLEDLIETQKKTGTSMGFIKVGAIDHLWIEEKPEEEKKVHDYHLEILRNQNKLSDEAEKRLTFLPYRIFVQWRCRHLQRSKICPGHKTEVLDGTIGELIRKSGIEKALQRIRQLGDVNQFDLAFFMSNAKAYPQQFSIIGLWYPDKQEVVNLKSQLSLF